MPFPDLNMRDPVFLARSIAVPLLSNPGFVNTTNWVEFSRAFQIGPDTASVKILWVHDWSNARALEMAGNVVNGAGEYVFGPSMTDFGNVAGPDGGPARRLRAEAASNSYVYSAQYIPVRAHGLYNFKVSLRRFDAPFTTGNALSIDEFQGFTALEDSSLFSTKIVNPAIRKEMEGGFVSTRRRYTRTITEISTGFTDINDQNKVRFEKFVSAVGGGSAAFAYSNPVTGELLRVRFKETPTFSYAGMGGVHRWNCKDIKLETV